MNIDGPGVELTVDGKPAWYGTIRTYTANLACYFVAGFGFGVCAGLVAFLFMQVSNA